MSELILYTLLLSGIFLFLLLFFATLMAPSSANKEWLESINCGRMEILQIRHLYLKRCYEPSRLYVHKMAVIGTLGLVVVFIILLILSKSNLV